MKQVFNRLKMQGKIEIVEGTRSSATLWKKSDIPVEDENKQLSFDF